MLSGLSAGLTARNVITASVSAWRASKPNQFSAGFLSVRLLGNICRFSKFLQKELTKNQQLLQWFRE